MESKVKYLRTHKFSAEALRGLMEEQGLSGLQLSFRARVAQARISDLLLGKTLNPRLETVTRLASALGVGVEALLRPADDLECVK